jgi:dolichol kinase
LTVAHTLSKELPVIVIDAVAGLVGFLLALGWWKASGRELDRSAVVFCAKMFAGIVLFGFVLAFIL